jgi:hypothetical protein
MKGIASRQAKSQTALMGKERIHRGHATMLIDFLNLFVLWSSLEYAVKNASLLFLDW